MSSFGTFWRNLKRAYHYNPWYGWLLAGLAAVAILWLTYKISQRYTTTTLPFTGEGKSIVKSSNSVLLIWILGFVLAGAAFSAILYGMCQTSIECRTGEV